MHYMNELWKLSQEQVPGRPLPAAPVVQRVLWLPSCGKLDRFNGFSSRIPPVSEIVLYFTDFKRTSPVIVGQRNEKTRIFYPAAAKRSSSFRAIESRARAHRLWAKTAHPTPNCLWRNPLLVSLLSRKRFLNMPILPSV